MLDMFDTDQVASVSSYQNYPLNKPFVNTDWSRANPIQLSKAFPESNRDEIINSLKKLQEKLYQLELEQKNEQLVVKNLAETNNANTDNVYAAYPINNGFQVTNSYAYDESTNKPSCSTNNSFNEPPSYLKHLVNIDEKAMNTEKRVLELEKQLERMRKMIRDDSDSNLINNSNTNKKQAKLDKKKRQIDNTIIESDTTLRDVDQVFSSNDDNSSLKIKTNRSKKKKTNRPKLKLDSLELELNSRNASNKCNLNRSRSADDHHIQQHKSHQHFKLNLGDIPFVVGKSTTPSHHLGTNIQNVFSLLKQHHPKLCGKFNSSCKSSDSNATTSSKSTQRHECRRARCSAPLDNHLVDESKVKRSKSTPLSTVVSNLEKSTELNCLNEKKKKPKETHKPVRDVDSMREPPKLNASMSSEDNLMSNVDWNELLRILQEEYTKLVLHHYDLTKKIINCIDDSKRIEYELKAEYLHRKMKTKAKQINKLKAIQQYKTSSSSTNNKRTSVEHNQNQANLFTTATKSKNSPQKYSYLKTQTNTLTNNSLSLSSSVDKQMAQAINPKTLKLFKDIKNFQNRFHN